MKRNGTTYLCIALIICFLGVFFLYPLFLAARQGFVKDGHISLYWFSRIIANRALLEKIANGLLLASCTTILSTLIALPLALLNARTKFRGQGVANGLLLVPLILPPFVGALSVKHFWGQFGVVNLILERIGVLSHTPTFWPDWLGSGLAAVIVLLSLNLFPIMYLNITASIANLDPALIQAARNLGAGRFRTFWQVVLPLIRPGIFAGGSIVFVWSFTDIGTPLLVGYNNLAPVTIFSALTSADTSGSTYSLVFVVLMVAVTMYTIGKLSVGRSLIIDSPKGTTASDPERMGIARTLLIWSAFAAVMAIALLPHIGVVMLALSERWVTTIIPEGFTTRHIAAVIQQSETRQCILNSFKYAGIATVFDVVVGFMAAWIIVRRRSTASHILDVLVMLPLAVPGLVLAAGYVAMTVSGSLFEAIGPLRDPFLLLVIAYSVRRMPFVVRGMCAGLEQIPLSLEQAARNLGDTQIGAVIRVTLPLVAANLVASIVLVFSFSMIEVSDSLVLAQLPTHFPITKEIYNLAVIGGADAQNMAAALGLVSMFVLGSALGIAAILMGKKLGSIFRM